MRLRASTAAVAFLLAAGCGMGTAPAEVSTAVDAYFKTIDQGTWGATYDAGTTSEFRKATSKEEYEKLGKAIGDRLGKLVSKETSGMNIRNFNGVVSADVQYEAQFEKGKGTIAASLKKSDGKWLVQSFRVNSPVFLESAPTVACAGCGKPRPTDASFCPGCGKKVEPAGK